jgi:uncharacterized protein YlxP (DUF503 family)
MVIGTARVVLHLPASGSLKDKRQVVKSLLAQVQREFHVAAAEVEEQDRIQLAVLGLACVSTDARHADEVIAKAVHFVQRRATEAELLDYATEIVHAL